MFLCCCFPLGPRETREMSAIGTLKAYSFITIRAANLSLDVHRLVHLATRNWLWKEELLTQWTERVVIRLENIFPDSGHQNRSVWRGYLAHARYVLDSNLIGKCDKNGISLAWKFGLCLYNDGCWKEAEDLFVLVMEARKWVLGQEHPDTLTSMANLASTYRNQGRWKEAEDLDVQVMETSKRVLGQEHPSTLTSMANLSFTWRGYGRQADAVKLMEKCVQLRTRVLGADHPDTLFSLTTLLGWQVENLDISSSAEEGPGV